MLCLLVLYGCKRQILDPLNPQTNLPQKVQFDKVKDFYENGRYKNQPKRTSPNGNERMTVADSARFKDFEPQWDKTVVELLPNNEKMLIVPVVRFLPVDYSENIGFIRRLCIRVDANEDFIEANIVELVGNLTFVKENHNAIFKNYKENNISGFSGKIIEYQLDYDKVSYTDFDNGTGTNTSGDLVTVFDGVSGCIKVYDDTGNLLFAICGSDAPNPSSPPPGYNPPPSPPYVHVPFTPRGPNGPGYTPSNNPNAPVYNPPTGGGTGGGSNNPPPVVIPFVPPPPPPMPHPGMIWINDMQTWEFPIDPGFSWGETEGWGDGIPRDADGNEIVPMTSDDELKLAKFRKIFASNGKKGFSSKDLKLAKSLDSLRNISPLADSIYRKTEAVLRTRALTLGFTPEIYIKHLSGAVNGPSWGENFGKVTIDARGIPLIDLGEKISIEVFMEEFTHALQDLERNSNVAPNNDELVHMEMEAKIINHLIFGVKGGTPPSDGAPTPSLFAAFEATDVRRDISVQYGITINGVFTLIPTTTIQASKSFSTKYITPVASNNDSRANWKVIRYADVLLMYAEALNENGKTNEALNFLKMVRSRAGLEGYVNLTQAETRTKIYLERRLELSLEGQRWFDLVRTGRAFTNMQSMGMKPHMTIFPIPLTQIQIINNPSVFGQNPGY